MTDFMAQVEALAEGRWSPTAPWVVPAVRRGIAAGTDRYVAFRALAEQLVCEANAALGDTHICVELEDEATSARLSFILRCGKSSVRVSEEIQGASALVHLSGLDPSGQEVELANPDELAALMLELVRDGFAERAGRE